MIQNFSFRRSSESFVVEVVAKVNVDEETDLASEFGVFSIPTLVVLKNGKVANQAMGARPKEAILALLEG